MMTPIVKTRTGRKTDPTGQDGDVQDDQQAENIMGAENVFAVYTTESFLLSLFVDGRTMA